jgi:hypothetical protein
MLATEPAPKGDRMFFAAFAQLLSLLIDLATTAWRAEREKDLEILLLRRQLAILMRAQAVLAECAVSPAARSPSQRGEVGRNMTSGSTAYPAAKANRDTSMPVKRD